MGLGRRAAPPQLAFYVIWFLITFCILVALNANIERIRSGTLDLPRPFTPTEVPRARVVPQPLQLNDSLHSQGMSDL